MPKISVIVPVFNAEKTLQRCIDSILAQSFTDFELILIDDGSIDNSGKICDEYAQKDSRIVSVHQENGGVSSARNKGLDIARGEWITFVDSDDYISDFLCNFNFNSDLYLSKIEYFGEIRNTFECEFVQITSKNDIVYWLLLNYNKPHITAPWGKILYKKHLTVGNIRFNDEMKYGEDTDFILRYLIYCSTIIFDSNSCYYYNSLVADNELNKYSMDAYLTNKHLLKINKTIQKLEQHFYIPLNNIKRHFNTLYLSLFYKYLESHDLYETRKQLKMFNKLKLLKYPFYLNNKEYLYLILIVLFPFLYRR